MALALECTDRMLYHSGNGELVGRVCSAMFGHTIGAPLALGYLANHGEPLSSAWIESATMKSRSPTSAFRREYRCGLL